MEKKAYTVEESSAFTQVFEIEPTGKGELDGLSFAVKDLIDVKGFKTTCGNPSWAETAPKCFVNAVCVDQLLSCGAKCVGKALTDELAFSLGGENYFYGTPLNPKAPKHVPGGSSCGSASAVACGLADFALATDTGGSIRIPANNCGVYGMRPTSGRVSVAGVQPLAPTFDTVGIVSQTLDVLKKASSCLLGVLPVERELGSIYIIDEHKKVLDEEVFNWFSQYEEKLLKAFPNRVKKIGLKDIENDEEFLNFENWLSCQSVLLRAEIWSILGTWVESAKPQLGPRTKVNFELSKNLDRSEINQAVRRRERIFNAINSFLLPNDLIIMPTAPSLAPLKGSLPLNRHEDPYYKKTKFLMSLASLARLPQISCPIGSIDSIPHGLSLIGRTQEDAFLLGKVNEIMRRL